MQGRKLIKWGLNRRGTPAQGFHAMGHELIRSAELGGSCSEPDYTSFARAIEDIPSFSQPKWTLRRRWCTGHDWQCCQQPWCYVSSNPTISSLITLCAFSLFRSDLLLPVKNTNINKTLCSSCIIGIWTASSRNGKPKTSRPISTKSAALSCCSTIAARTSRSNS